MADSDVAPIVPPVIRPPTPAETPGKSLWFAFGWITASFAAAGLAGLFVGLFYRAGHAIGMPPPIFITLASGTSLQLVLLFAAFHRARIIGSGQTAAEALGFVPMRRKWLLVLLLVLGIGYSALWWAARRMMPLPHWAPDASSLEAVYANSATILRILLAILTVGLAPVAEELFYRGWLWTTLRRFWSPIPVMVATCLPWLAIHLLDNIRSPLLILFVGIILSLARHFCGSTRASIVLHVTNNFSASAMTASLYGLQ